MFGLGVDSWGERGKDDVRALRDGIASGKVCHRHKCSRVKSLSLRSTRGSRSGNLHPDIQVEQKTSQPQAVPKFTSLSREVARKGG